MDYNEQFKLNTRRWLAWGIGGLFAITIAFIGIWGTIHQITEYVTLAGGFAGGSLSSVLVFYFSKKLSEE